MKNKSFVEHLELPKDIVGKASILTAYGKNEVWIENYKGIIEYTKEMIVIQGKNIRIRVCGTNLVVDYYSNEEMKIVGEIKTIVYE